MPMLAIILFLRDYSPVFMAAAFALLVVTTYWPGRRDRFERDGMIPLEDDAEEYARGE
jgi:cbb3-type cytochrome oxidase subunit 3